MNENNRRRGLGGYFIFILVLLGIVIWIGTLRSNVTGYNWDDFMKDFEAEEIVSASIAPNSEVPTGTVYLELKEGTVKEMYVSDVTKVEAILYEGGISVMMQDIRD